MALKWCSSPSDCSSGAGNYPEMRYLRNGLLFLAERLLINVNNVLSVVCRKRLEHNTNIFLSTTFRAVSH
jgi:hypothetical protein